MSSRYLARFHLKKLDQQVADFLVIGSGVAGLSAALSASRYGSVLLITKDLLESNTQHAMGGVAAAVGDEDDWHKHWEDTIRAGAGLCDEGAVSILVREGPARVRELIKLGANFDMEGGRPALTREGGHSCRRILHANGDATGREVERALADAVRRQPSIRTVVPAYAVDLIADGETCYGALAVDPESRLTAYLARATILATGGAGQVYAETTNSAVVTGDGMAMAYRAGAALMDMEFFQFHPTGLKIPGAPRALISEAVRGEGGLLRDQAGRRFMPEAHPMAELAPRDVVARAIVQVMRSTGTDHVWLDVTHLKELDLPLRFPTVFETCMRYGLDIRKDWIPVSPVAHYFMGGVRVGYQGETNLRGLYACGETACLGLHGANRLASNSILDGLVFGHRVAEGLGQGGLPLSARELSRLDLESPGAPVRTTPQQAAEMKREIQRLMWNHVGLVREDSGLKEAARRLEALRAQLCPGSLHPAVLEAENLLTVAQLITRAAALRTESRGSHFRVDYPAPNDAQWLKRIVLIEDQVYFTGKEEVSLHELAQSTGA